MFAVVVFVLLVYLYSLFSRRLEGTALTIPLLFTVAGIVLFLAAPGSVTRDVESPVWLVLAEFTYAIVLFNGATRVDLRVLRSRMQLPGRLLFIGLPLTILLGGMAAVLVFPELSLWEAGVLACLLASTDTGLAERVVSSPRVPACIREALNAESGLSDGLIVPLLMLFVSLIKADASGPAGTVFLRVAVQQIVYGIPVGLAIGFAGGWLLGLARRQGWASLPFQQIAMIALAPLCLIAADAINTSPFITAFAAGIALQIGFRDASEGIVEFSENEGRLLNMFVFFLFGTSAGAALGEIHLAPVAYAILSLTLVRLLPVAISMIGTRLSASSVVFMGWFGPRGLASIVLGLVVAEQQVQTSGLSLVRTGLVATVLLSVLAHGLSAAPGIKLYAQQVARLGPDAPEFGTAARTPAA
jgi:NhaP-type Na+/H+ or K+/H+ antiporter